jgi:hypothetical protein
MRRRLFAVVSLLMFLAMVGLWVRSIHHYDGVVTTSPARSWILQSGLGYIELDRWNGLPPGHEPERLHYATYVINRDTWRLVIQEHKKTTMADFGYTRQDFRFEHYVTRSGNPPRSSYPRTINRTLLRWSAPIWFFVLIFFIVPAVLFVRSIFALHGGKHSRCLVCGYNLTGNTSGTCPECGTPVPEP